MTRLVCRRCGLELRDAAIRALWRRVGPKAIGPCARCGRRKLTLAWTPAPPLTPLRVQLELPGVRDAAGVLEQDLGVEVAVADE